MKTTKKLLVLCLVLIMGIVAFMPSTFSWYNHSGTLTGRAMNYIRTNLPVSAGVVESYDTRKYRMKSDNEVYYDDKGNKEYDGTVNSNADRTVSAGHSQYYGTTLINKSLKPVFVNLYLKNLTNSKNVFVGTTSPSLTDKAFSSSAHLANKNQIRVYVQFQNANNWNTSGAKRYVVCTNKLGRKSCTEITEKINNDNNSVFGTNYTNTYYVDLAENTTEFYFATDGNKSGFDTTNYTTTMAWYRTKTITAVQAETGYVLKNQADDTTWNVMYDTFDVPGGISTMKYYDEVHLNSGQKTYINLKEGVNYTGSSVSYSLDDDSEDLSNTYCTINNNTGMINATSTALPSNSNFTIYTTITSPYGDSIQVETTVKNPAEVAATPIAMNIKVPAQKTEYDANGVPVVTDGKVLVEWYIRNTGGSDCSFDSIYYTK